VITVCVCARARVRAVFFLHVFKLVLRELVFWPSMQYFSTYCRVHGCETWPLAPRNDNIKMDRSISDSQGGEYEDGCLLGCSDV
jgi:hypothetical protein